MKKHNRKTPITEEGFELRFRFRATKSVSIQIPNDVLKSLKHVAASRDISVQALLKQYIGQGLRPDLAKLFGDRVLENTEQVLTRHIQSEKKISAILKEIRVKSVTQ